MSKKPGKVFKFLIWGFVTMVLASVGAVLFYLYVLITAPRM